MNHWRHRAWAASFSGGEGDAAKAHLRPFGPRARVDFQFMINGGYGNPLAGAGAGCVCRHRGLGVGGFVAGAAQADCFGEWPGSLAILQRNIKRAGPVLGSYGLSLKPGLNPGAGFDRSFWLPYGKRMVVSFGGSGGVACPTGPCYLGENAPPVVPLRL